MLHGEQLLNNFKCMIYLSLHRNALVAEKLAEKKRKEVSMIFGKCVHLQCNMWNGCTSGRFFTSRRKSYRIANATCDSGLVLNYGS